MTSTMKQEEPKGNVSPETASETVRWWAAQLLAEVDRRVDAGADFAERELALHALANEAVQCAQQQQLQTIADRFVADEVVVDGVRYRLHDEGTVEYHGLSGALPVHRSIYRQVGVRNGPTIVPVELVAGMVERSTPALANALLTGYANKPSREIVRSMQADLRRPPSRKAIEGFVKRAGKQLRIRLDSIEPVLRAREQLPEGTKSSSTGLDRTAIPMHELLELDPDAPPPKKSKRTKDYERTPPEPFEVNWRMAYVGTVSFIDADGRELRTVRYAVPAEEGPSRVVEAMMRDLVHARRQVPELPVALVQDGAPEMWNLMEAALAAHGIEPEHKLNDRYHLDDHLSNVLRAMGYTPAAREKQLSKWNKQLDEDDDAIDEIEAFVRKARWTYLGEACRKLIDELTYLENNKHRMRYASARRAGLVCGSGATEGACKSVVKVRMCRSGQAWKPEGAANAMTLRALFLSDRLPGAIELLRGDHYAAEVRIAA